MELNNFKLGKKGASEEMSLMVRLVIGLAILVIVGFIIYWILTGKMVGAVEFIKNMFRFGN